MSTRNKLSINKDKDDERIIDFLKEAIAYTENRIALVDNKASILIGIQSVFSAMFTYVVKEMFLSIERWNIKVASYVILGVAFIISMMSTFLLLKVIRPSKRLLGLRIRFNNMQVKNYVMWFDGDFPSTPHEYKERIKVLSLTTIKENYEKTHYTILQLIKSKYIFYRWAMLGMKLLVLWGAIGISFLMLLKWIIK